MSETFFIGDTHMGHNNILDYESKARPFSCLEDMHEAIITRWNSVVTKYDKVYHLGDFAFGKKNIEIAAQLNGQKRLILGNHDCYPMDEYLKYFKSVHGVLFWNKCVLTHMPVHPCNFDRAEFNVHGHLHSSIINDGRYINVSCEQNNLTPINASELFNVRIL